MGPLDQGMTTYPYAFGNATDPGNTDESGWRSIASDIGQNTLNMLLQEAQGGLFSFLSQKQLEPAPAAYWALGLGMQRAGYTKVKLGGTGYGQVLAFAGSFYRLLRCKVDADIMGMDVDTRFQKIGALGSEDVKGAYSASIVNYLVISNPGWENYGSTHPLVKPLLAGSQADAPPTKPKTGLDLGKYALPLVGIGALIFFIKK